ncbi:MAG TPA: hypothetical protein VFC78_01175 [Tepidisphaeraceae bacterium]|nr:hypothetical protein [Tepidisphaeraceae bacterium]
MFHLGGTDFPTTRDQLANAVGDGLRAFFTFPAEAQVVWIEGGEYPAFERVAIDLTGARADADRLPPEPRGVGPSRAGVSAAQLEVAGHPVYVREVAVELSLHAASARFNYDRDKNGRPLLVLEDARDGQISIGVKKPDLEALLLAAARQAAARQSVQISEGRLSLTQINDRSVAIEIRVKAKRLFVSAVVTVRGTLAVDDALKATASGLACAGEGMLGDMACNFIRPHLQKAEGRAFPLTALSLGQVRLRDLRVSVGDSLSMTAAFGS